MSSDSASVVTDVVEVVAVGVSNATSAMCCGISVAVGGSAAETPVIDRGTW